MDQGSWHNVQESKSTIRRRNPKTNEGDDDDDGGDGDDDGDDHDLPLPPELPQVTPKTPHDHQKMLKNMHTMFKNVA